MIDQFTRDAIAATLRELRKDNPRKKESNGRRNLSHESALVAGAAQLAKYGAKPDVIWILGGWPGFRRFRKDVSRPAEVSAHPRPEGVPGTRKSTPRHKPKQDGGWSIKGIRDRIKRKLCRAVGKAYTPKPVYKFPKQRRQPWKYNPFGGSLGLLHIRDDD